MGGHRPFHPFQSDGDDVVDGENDDDVHLGPFLDQERAPLRRPCELGDLGRIFSIKTLFIATKLRHITRFLSKVLISFH